MGAGQKDDDIFSLAQSEARERGDSPQMPLYDGPMDDYDEFAPSRKAVPQDVVINKLANHSLAEMRKQTEILSSIRTILVLTLIVIPICLIVLGVLFHH